jgi:hypothetical protein
MRHTKWILILWISLALVVIRIDRAETRSEPSNRSIVDRAASLAHPDEIRERSSSWQMVGQVGGPTQAVAVQGDYAYVGIGLRLVVLDVSQPITPTEIGSTTPFSDFVESLVVSGTLAYVATGGGGLRMVDISDPAHPLHLGGWDSPGFAEGVAISRSTVYLADGPYGLRVVDVSDPALPAEAGYACPLKYAFDVAVDGSTAYLAAAGAGLLVIDISDPRYPVELGSLDTPGYAYGVDTVGDMAYVADGRI